MVLVGWGVQSLQNSGFWLVREYNHPEVDGIYIYIYMGYIRKNMSGFFERSEVSGIHGLYQEYVRGLSKIMFYLLQDGCSFILGSMVDCLIPKTHTKPKTKTTLEGRGGCLGDLVSSPMMDFIGLNMGLHRGIIWNY